METAAGIWVGGLGDLGEKDFKGESCVVVRVIFRKRVVVGVLFPS